MFKVGIWFVVKKRKKKKKQKKPQSSLEAEPQQKQNKIKSQVQYKQESFPVQFIPDSIYCFIYLVILNIKKKKKPTTYFFK